MLKWMLEGKTNMWSNIYDYDCKNGGICTVNNL